MSLTKHTQGPCAGSPCSPEKLTSIVRNPHQCWVCAGLICIQGISKDVLNQITLNEPVKSPDTPRAAQKKSIAAASTAENRFPGGGHATAAVRHGRCGRSSPAVRASSHPRGVRKDKSFQYGAPSHGLNGHRDGVGRPSETNSLGYQDSEGPRKGSPLVFQGGQSLFPEGTLSAAVRSPKSLTLGENQAVQPGATRTGNGCGPDSSL